MVIKKNVFKKIGLFRADLGRQHNKLLSYEETDLIERARDAGFGVLFMPTAIVYHKVKSHRLTLNYILKWQYYFGKSIKIAKGYSPLITSYSIIKNMLSMANPRVIFSTKSVRIAKIAYLVNLIGQLI